jgi:hypothetical protein
MIVYLVSTAETQKRVEWTLGKAVEESARSGDGFCGVLVLNNRKGVRRNLDRIALVTGGLQFTDNRDKDANTTVGFVQILTDGE